MKLYLVLFLLLLTSCQPYTQNTQHQKTKPNPIRILESNTWETVDGNFRTFHYKAFVENSANFIIYDVTLQITFHTNWSPIALHKEFIANKMYPGEIKEIYFEKTIEGGQTPENFHSIFQYFDTPNHL